MNHYFEGTVINNLKSSPETSLTVFKKKEDRWEKLLDPFYAEETKNIPRIESWQKIVTISFAINHPIGNKTCKVNKMENGTYKGPTQNGNFKWEVEITSNKESYSSPNANIEIEICD